MKVTREAGLSQTPRLDIPITNKAPDWESGTKEINKGSKELKWM